MRRILLAVLSLFLAPAHVAAEACGWMDTAELDRLLPGGAPWSLMTGGAIGSCKFTGNPRGSGGAVVIGANQMLKADAAEAAKTAQALRGPLSESYTVEPLPALGEHGFRYLPKTPGPRTSISYVGHYKHVVITGQLVLPVGADPAAHADGAVAFYKAALAVADDPAATAASQCPYFDDALLRRLLPGKAYSQQVFGSNSCMAQDGSGMALVLSIVEGVGDDVAARMRDGGCTWTAAAELGEGGHVGHACSGGRPRAMVEMRVGSKLLKYAFAGAREPSDAERALLLEMAVKVRGGG